MRRKGFPSPNPYLNVVGILVVTLNEVLDVAKDAIHLKCAAEEVAQELLANEQPVPRNKSEPSSRIPSVTS